jgi:hypothetical protein
MEGAPPGSTCFMSLDATDCPIQEPHPFDDRYFSFKLHGAGLKYEVGVSIYRPRIVWVFGGLPCGEFSDLKLARELFVHNLLHNDIIHEKAVADGVYRDHNHFITPLYNPQSVISQQAIRSRHENVNGKIKRFRCLTSVFRHDRENHYLCFLL